jgi:cation:H+ antiporter
MPMPFEMTIFWAVLLLPTGLAILIKGADLLVDGAVALAERLGISPLIIGLTVVAMGTSAPEVAASIDATLHNLGDTAIGNVYGSNIANLALVGGLAALIRPITVKLSTLKREMPVMIIVALLLYPLLADKQLSRSDSLLLLVGFFVLIIFTAISGLVESKRTPAHADSVAGQIADKGLAKSKSLISSIVFIIIGLLALAGGAELTVQSAKCLGSAIGLSDAVIGLTIVAVGTSLPELVTCVIAALKGHDDISIGNLVGSNVFNTMLVVGSAGAIRPFAINARLIGSDYWIMIAVSVMFVLIALIGKRINRIAGTILLAVYAGYMVYLFGFTRAV